MADNFDLQKFLKESKVLENRYYKDAEADDAEHIDALEKDMKDDKNSSTKSKIREYILAELTSTITSANEDEDFGYAKHDGSFGGDDSDYEDEDYSDYFFDIDTEEDLEEAKKKKKEDTEDIEDVNIEDTDIEDMPAEDISSDNNGIEDLAADMKGTEADLMDHLMKALQIAKGMQNEKLETQVGNTLKFFVSEYIGGDE
jgi:hypothetical protein